MISDRCGPDIKIVELLPLCMSGMYLSLCPKFLQVKCDHLISIAKDATALYSDTALDLETVFYFFDDQLINQITINEKTISKYGFPCIWVTCKVSITKFYHPVMII